MRDAPSWHRVKEVLQATLSRPPEEHDDYVRQTCQEEPSLRAEVESLLAAIGKAGSFMESDERAASLSAAFPAGWIPDLGWHVVEPGDTLGHYTILEFIGAGGMGEVYRARDTNLDRDVALKVRPAAFALDADRFARVRREAQILAAMNHPNIAAIYGLESREGIQALVLELVDGPTLASRIASGRVPVVEALSIGRQIATGLEAAHTLGIVHSDLKPANIKLRPDGTVKILDFGLAKALDTVDGPASHEAGAPGDEGISHAGLVFGTAAYMSPEQARGEPVDRRTDVWAFGCVLYEMLVGRPAFQGDGIEEILAAVRNQEPDWSLLPPTLPDGVARLLRKCLEKDANHRLHDIADARTEIEDANGPMTRSITPRTAWLMVAGAAALAVTAGVWNVTRPTSPEPDGSRIRRLELRLPEGGPLARTWSMPLGVGQPSIAISPDGARLVYVLERQGVTQLYLRVIDQMQVTPIPGTERGFGPFFSPDGSWIGFFAGNKLKKVATAGGEPIELCDAPNPFGGSWGRDGIILFAPDEGRRPALVPETGGTPQPIVVRNSAGSFRQPDLLPGGKAAIVSNPLRGNVGVLSLDTGEFRPLVERAGGGRYAPSGHLVFARSGALRALSFDPEKLTVTGPEHVILEGVRMDAAGPVVPQAAFSREGTLVYAPGSWVAQGATRPVWVDRQGRTQPLGMTPGPYGAFSLSPDGQKLAIGIAGDLWVRDLERGTMTLLTMGAGTGRSWWWDNTRIVFGWRTNRAAQILMVPSDGSRKPELITHGLVATSLSPDHKWMAGFRQDPVTGQDLWVAPLKGPPPLQPFLRTRFSEVGPRFSPDARWLAYVSDESGGYEVYVRPYPGPGGTVRVSTGGGQHPLWSRDGKELFYRTGQKWMSAAVTLGPEFTAEKPRLLFEGASLVTGAAPHDVSPDGQRFLVLERTEQESAPVTHLNVVLNWFEELREKTSPTSAPR